MSGWRLATQNEVASEYRRNQKFREELDHRGSVFASKGSPYYEIDDSGRLHKIDRHSYRALSPEKRAYLSAIVAYTGIVRISVVNPDTLEMGLYIEAVRRDNPIRDHIAYLRR
ncbi:MAG: hypothetical protein KGH62_05595 [Candidatus Micrarchaeota archaeon]|nr:hypothetical protein [Candidatus Micrarchaeota archaeon]